MLPEICRDLWSELFEVNVQDVAIDNREILYWSVQSCKGSSKPTPPRMPLQHKPDPIQLKSIAHQEFQFVVFQFLFNVSLPNV